MIRLKNIRKNNNIIECEIFPEDCKENGYLSVEIDSEEIVKYELPIGYEWCTNHIAHAERELLDMAKNNNVQKEKTIIWY